VREGERYVILDLESANGVRVGGVEHDRVELQGGDVIELGEVKLRFITGDSALYDEPAVWYQDKRKLAALLGVTAVGVGALLYFAFSGPSAPKLPPPSSPVVAPPAEPAPATPPPAPAPKPTVEPTVPTADLLAEAKTTAQAEKWDEALALIAKAVAQEPGSADAANLRKAIEAEKQYSEKFAALKTALDNKDFDTVLQGAAEIPNESMYKPRVVEMQKKAQGLYLVAHLEVATAKLAAKECDEARREADLVLAVEAKNKKAAAVVRRCEAMAAKPEPAPKPEPVAASPKPTPRHTPAPVMARPGAPKPTAAKPVEAAKPEPAGGGADPDKLIKDAQQAWLRGQHAAAIDSARKALRLKPNLTIAYQIIAICSCALRDADAAAKAYEKLDERNKHLVKQSCQKSGISF